MYIHLYWSWIYIEKFNFVLSIQIILLFFHHRELLSRQQHYDWGLRALKTVLRGCGNLLQAQKHAGNKGNPHTCKHVRYLTGHMLR